MAKKYVVIDGYCSTSKRPLGIQCEARNDGYAVVGSFVSYGGAAGKSEDVAGSFYVDKFECKYCGNTGLVRCRCGAVICGDTSKNQVKCPACGNTIDISWGESVDMSARSSKQ